MKELGEYLKENRQNQGVSIEEAAEDLKIEPIELESIEIGNTRAFKDVYTLKELIKQYAKYLGLDPEKVLDEFNDFLFERTSKISLDDIKEAKKKSEEKEEIKKITSPYTKERKEYFKFVPWVIGTLVLVLLFVLGYYLIDGISSGEEKISTELKGNFEVEEIL